MTGTVVRGTAVAVAILALALGVGCGGGDDSEPAQAGLPMAGGGGSLALAVPGLPETVDPLDAVSSVAQLVSRQIHEPLVSELVGPYGDREGRPGLALSIQPSQDRTIWTLRLRSGVRFQDGTPFNASAVVVNARRWLSLPAGRALLPQLSTVDATGPNEARFVLDSPVADLAALLAAPQLGIVSPHGLRPRNGVGADLTEAEGQSGTGPFQVGERDGEEIHLERHEHWWGSRLGLGPALDWVAFKPIERAAERVEALRNGDVHVALGLGAAALRAVRSEPLLVTDRAGGSGMGLDGSVRGLHSGGPIPSLSWAWLTNVGD